MLRESPDVEHAAGAVTVRVPLPEGDHAVDHDRP